MGTLMTKQQFADLLNSSIQDEQLRAVAINNANELIPEDDERNDLATLNSKRMRFVYSSYRRLNHGHRNMRPTLDKVLSWLHLSSGLPFIVMLEERLAEVYKAVMDLGAIDPDEDIPVKGTTILRLRYLSYVDPECKPIPLRKKRVVKKK